MIYAVNTRGKQETQWVGENRTRHGGGTGGGGFCAFGEWKDYFIASFMHDHAYRPDRRQQILF